MKFQLGTTKIHYKQEEDKDDIEDLKTLGFVFDFSGDRYRNIDGNPEIEFSTLDELMAFVKRWDAIIVQVYDDVYLPEIEIFNDVRE